MHLRASECKRSDQLSDLLLVFNSSNRHASFAGELHLAVIVSRPAVDALQFAVLSWGGRNQQSGQASDILHDH